MLKDPGEGEKNEKEVEGEMHLRRGAKRRSLGKKI